jgi:hypothetical protein
MIFMVLDGLPSVPATEVIIFLTMLILDIVPFKDRKLQGFTKTG